MVRASAPRFQTRAQVDRYFTGKTIKCLVCGRWFRRLATHLAFKHDMDAAEYKARFGLPWTRGLTSDASHRKSGWTKKRRLQARRLAKKTRFFDFAHLSPRRESPAYIRDRWTKSLGKHARGFDRQFERRVYMLFKKRMIDREIAEVLGVDKNTVNRRTRRWRTSKNSKPPLGRKS